MSSRHGGRLLSRSRSPVRFHSRSRSRSSDMFSDQAIFNRMMYGLQTPSPQPIPKLLCSGCGLRFATRLFSKNQKRKGANRRCVDCIHNDTKPGVYIINAQHEIQRVESLRNTNLNNNNSNNNRNSVVFSCNWCDSIFFTSTQLTVHCNQTHFNDDDSNNNNNNNNNSNNNNSDSDSKENELKDRASAIIIKILRDNNNKLSKYHLSLKFKYYNKGKTWTDSFGNKDKIGSMDAFLKNNHNFEIIAKKNIRSYTITLKNKKKNDKNDQDHNECVICLDKNKSYLCIPCGHLCLCVECKDLINNKCPICQQVTTGCYKLFK